MWAIIQKLQFYFEIFLLDHCNLRLLSVVNYSILGMYLDDPVSRVYSGNGRKNGPARATSDLNSKANNM